jgi:hypothetical protein
MPLDKPGGGKHTSDMSEGNVEKAILAALRKQDSPLLERVTLHNQILVHNFKHSVARTCECQLMGCTRSFAITLVPNQALYPKYCESHRTEFRRKDFLRRLLEKPGVYRIREFRVAMEPAAPPRPF